MTLLAIAERLLPALGCLVAGTLSACSSDEPVGELAVEATADREEEEEGEKGEPNRLIHEKSVYLQQHAYNPVDWFPWGDEAFEKARSEDKPVFMSIGYSTCHWCHVMERESFEDEEIAAYLNENFVSIKVDREERPDVDSIYMSYVQMRTGRGGWPLTTFLDHERRPFLGGTYFPPRDKGQYIGFLTLLKRIRATWDQDRESIEQNGEQLVRFLESRSDLLEGDVPYDLDQIDRAYRQYAQLFDTKYGGRAGAPKFPAAVTMQMLLRYEQLTGDEKALELVEKTLRSMADGGMYDQLGGGFARYSTDEKWLVPHFEKMLYDNSLLARAYTEAYQRTGESRYREVATGILEYLLRDMQLAGGAFAAAEDADSEGEEGLFYTWTPAEVRVVLGAELAAVAMEALGITEQGQLDGRSVLHRTDLYGRVDPKQRQEAMDLLFEARSDRERPLRDDKVLSAWNGLAISAFAFAGRVFDEPRYIAAAADAAGFVLDHLYVDGTLLRRWRDGEAILQGYLVDYSYLTQGLLDLYESDFDLRWLEAAIELNESTWELFGDPETGTFYDTATTGEALLVRTRDPTDGAIPAGNAVALKNLVRLSDLLVSSELRQRAELGLRSLTPSVRALPMGYIETLNAIAMALEPPREVVFAGEKGAPDTEALIREYYREFRPFRVLAFAPTDEKERARAEKRLEVVRGKVPVDGRAAAYQCENYTCLLPVTDPAEIGRD